MSPEQALGRTDEVDRRADVFSLGAILCEILTGDSPYAGATTKDKLQEAREGNLSDAFNRLDQCGTDAELVELAKQCLASNLGIRLHQARQATLIANARAEEEVKRRRLVVALAASTIAFMIIAGLGFIYSKNREAKLANERSSLLAQRVKDSDKIELQNRKIQATNDQLIVASKVADQQRDRAQIALAEMETARGFFAGQLGQIDEAPLWFCKAAETAREHPAHHRANRMRARNWMSALPVPQRAFSLRYPATRVQGLSFLSDGSLLLIQRSDGISVYDWKNETLIDRPWGKVSAVASSLDGTRLATCDENGELRSWAVGPFSSEVLHDSIGPCEVMRFSPNRRYLVAGSNPLTVYDFELKELVSPIEIPSSLPDSITFSSDSSAMIIGASKGEVFRVRMDVIRDGKGVTPEPLFLVESLDRSTQPVQIEDDLFIAIGPNRKLFQYGSVTKPLFHPTKMGEPIRFFKSSDRRRYLISSGKVDAVLYRFPLAVDDTSSKAKVRPDPKYATLEQGNNRVFDAAFSADEETLITVAADQSARLWDSSTGAAIGPPILHPAMIRQCAINADGTFFATLDQEARVRIYKRDVTLAYESLASNFGKQAGRSISGRYLMPRQWHQDPWHVPGCQSLTVFDTQTDTLLEGFETEEMKAEHLEIAETVTDSVINADETILVAIVSSPTRNCVVGWDLASREMVLPRIVLDKAAHAIAARPGTNQVSLLLDGDRIVVIDLDAKKIVHQYQLSDSTPSNRPWETLRYSPNGKRLVVLTSGFHNRIEVRNSDTGLPCFPAISPVLRGGPCRVVEISPTGRRLATAVNGDNAVQVWDMETGAPLCQPLRHPGDIYGVYSLAFSEDELSVFTGHKDGQVRIWDYGSEQLVGPTLDHDDGVWSLLPFRYQDPKSGSVPYLACGSRSGQVSLWDLETNKRISPPIDCGDSVISLAVDSLARSLYVTTSSRINVLTPASLVRVDLASKLQLPETDLITQTKLAEVISGRTIQSGTTSLLNATDWGRTFRSITNGD